MEEHDVVVVGRGCAGASAAFFTKRLCPERSVLLLDRLDEGKFRKYHRMCGEAVSEAAFRQLAPLRPDNVVHDITTVTETWPGGVVMRAKAIGYVLDRPLFIKGIVNRFVASGGVSEEDAAVAVEPEASGFVVRLSSGRSVRARFLVGADGAHSRVRQEVFREAPPVMTWTEQYVVEKDLPKDTIQFIQGERYKGGYRWEFPSGRYAKIGFPRGTDRVEEEVVETHRRAIPSGGLSRVVKGRCMLVGDAAAMPNPLTAGGIRTALLSGRRAAEAIASGELSSFEGWWRGSPFSDPMYLKALRQFEGMTDDDYSRASEPFRGGYGALSYVRARLSLPQYREVYRAYLKSSQYGW